MLPPANGRRQVRWKATTTPHRRPFIEIICHVGCAFNLLLATDAVNGATRCTITSNIYCAAALLTTAACSRESSSGHLGNLGQTVPLERAYTSTLRLFHVTHHARLHFLAMHADDPCNPA